MNIVLSYSAGQSVEGVLLAASRYTLRVAIPDRPDVEEFQLTGGQWMSEEGEPVQIEALFTDGRAEMADYFYGLLPRVCSAGC